MRSSFLLFRTLNERGVCAALRSGRPVDGGGSGLLTATGWQSHAWIEAGGHIVDITADQFGHAPVIVVPSDHPAYRHAADPGRQLASSRAAVDAVAALWPSWQAYLDGRI